MKQANEINTTELQPARVDFARETPVEEVMCWRDPNKACNCKQPQQGVFCGRFPLPTD